MKLLCCLVGGVTLDLGFINCGDKDNLDDQELALLQQPTNLCAETNFTWSHHRIAFVH